MNCICSLNSSEAPTCAQETRECMTNTKNHFLITIGKDWCCISEC